MKVFNKINDINVIKNSTEYQELNNDIDNNKILETITTNYNKKINLPLLLKNRNFFRSKTPNKRLKILFLFILCYVKFVFLNNWIKLYGTSSISYDFNYRTKDLIKLKLFKNIEKASNINTIKIPSLMINGSGIFYSGWNIFIMILIIYNMIFLPITIFYSTYFEINDSSAGRNLELIDNYVNYFFIIDVFINFNSSILDKNGHIIIDRKIIVISYLKSFFLIDMLSSLPIDLILDNFTNSNNNTTKFIKFLKILKFFRILKISGLSKIVNYNKDIAYTYRLKLGLISILKFLAITLFILHFFGCLWVLIGFSQGDSSNNWLDYFNISKYDNFFLIYTISIYYCFVTLTTVGYGDIYPTNTYEMIFAIVWMLIGISLYSIAIGLITSFFQNRENKQSLLEKKMNNVKLFCKNNNISKALEEKIKDNLIFSIDKISYLWLDRQIDFYKDLNLELKYEFLKEVYKELISENPFFEGKEISFITTIVPLLKPIRLKEGEALWKSGSYANSIIFITKGELNFFMKNKYYNSLKLSKSNNILSNSDNNINIIGNYINFYN